MHRATLPLEAPLRRDYRPLSSESQAENAGRAETTSPQRQSEVWAQVRAKRAVTHFWRPGGREDLRGVARGAPRLSSRTSAAVAGNVHTLGEPLAFPAPGETLARRGTVVERLEASTMD